MQTQTTSQNETIIGYLKAGYRITALEALDLYGIFRLSARIYDLRRAGHDIETEHLQQGRKCFASYKLSDNAAREIRDRQR